MIGDCMEVVVLCIGIPHICRTKLDLQSLFSHQSFLIDIFEHVPRRHIGFGTVVGVGLLPIGCQLTPVVEIVRMERFTVLVFIVAEVSALE